MLATLTTNFVNIYMSALALKSLRPATADRTAIWIIGGIGAAISVLSSAWLDQMANFTLLLAGVFVPVGGVLIAHFVCRRASGSAAELYFGPDGEPPGVGLWSVAGMSAWCAGAMAFYTLQPLGGVAPGLAVSVAVYLSVSAFRQRGRTGRRGPSASRLSFDG